MGFPRAQDRRGARVCLHRRSDAVGTWDGAVCGSRCPTVRSGSERLRVWLGCVVCCTVGGSSVGFLARGRLTQRHSWAHVGLAQQVEIGSDQEFEAQTITDTYHFDERGTVFRSRQRKEWCSIKTGCHRTGCSCPVLMHDISSDLNDKYPTPPPSM